VTLDELVRRAAARTPDAIAAVAPDATLTYAALDGEADRAAAGLHALGVRRGDRVALYGEKSARLVAAMQGVLRLGAAYVPIDPQAPPLRARLLCADCDVRALVTSSARAAELGDGLPPLLATDDAAWNQLRQNAAPARPPMRESDLAYVLYTSGSTGRPKGVCLSHSNALAFVEWAAAETALAPGDVLSNHAPFHFDLSVFDLYAAFFVGARVCLVPEAAAYAPRRLVELVARERVSVWYSVPSALILMMEHGALLDTPLPSLRAIVFAGEVFPPRHLLRLRRGFAQLRMWNWYGPTETNVCTSYELAAALPDGALPAIPIGRAACGDQLRVAEDGELHVDGPTVMLGYWGRDPQRGAYATGDLVRQNAAGELDYVGRRDHLMKVRGIRIEPGEIEAALLQHPELREAAVTVAGAGVEARLVAFVAGAPWPRPSLLELKGLCARRLPRPMIVDEVRWLDALPRTANGKVDRARLTEWAQTRAQTPGGAP
jgi:amino acid adenylation domain-containing protein